MNVIRFTPAEFDRFVLAAPLEHPSEDILRIIDKVSLPSFTLVIDGISTLSYEWHESTKILTIWHSRFMYETMFHPDKKSYSCEKYVCFQKGKEKELAGFLFKDDSSYNKYALMYVHDFWRVQWYLLYCLPTAYKIMQQSHELEEVHRTRNTKAPEVRKVVLCTTYVFKYPRKELMRSTPGDYSSFACTCWGVRGHYRRLANGKEVFIKPYKKGRNRAIEDPADREYLVRKDQL